MRVLAFVTKKSFLIGLCGVVLIVIVAGVLSTSIRASREAELRAKATAVAEKYRNDIKEFVSTRLKDAIIEGEEADLNIVVQDTAKRPPPPPSIDAGFSPEQRLAMKTPYPLPAAESLKKVSQLTLPTLERVDESVVDLGPSYREVVDMSKDAEKMYQDTILLYTTRNSYQELENNISAFRNEMWDVDEKYKVTNIETAKLYFAARLSVFEKYYKEIVNDETKKYIKSSDMGVFERQMPIGIEAIKNIQKLLNSGVTGDAYDKQYERQRGSYLEVASMSMAISFSRFSAKRSAVSIVNSFSKRHFPDDPSLLKW